MDESQPMQLRATMYRELAQYIAPKRKAIEVTGEDGTPIKGELTLTAWLDAINGKSLEPPSGRPGYQDRVRRHSEINRQTLCAHLSGEQGRASCSLTTISEQAVVLLP